MDSPHEYGAPGGRFHHQRPLVTVMSVSARDNGDMKGIETSFLVTSILVFLSLAVSAVLMRPKKCGRSGEKNLPPLCREDSSHIIITIAREYGSGGREIGLKVAQALKIPFMTGN